MIIRGELSGDDIAYIYPDCSTALVGTFSNGVMVCGQACQMVDLEEDDHGVKIPVLVRSNLHSDHVHYRQIGLYNFICKGGMKVSISSDNQQLIQIPQQMTHMRPRWCLLEIRISQEPVKDCLLSVT